MTKVQASFKFSRSLTDRDLQNIRRIHSVYGFFGAQLKNSGDEIFIEYDASRLSLKEVRGTLEEHGLPIQ